MADQKVRRCVGIAFLWILAGVIVISQCAMQYTIPRAPSLQSSRPSQASQASRHRSTKTQMKFGALLNEIAPAEVKSQNNLVAWFGIGATLGIAFAIGSTLALNISDFLSAGGAFLSVFSASSTATATHTATASAVTTATATVGGVTASQTATATATATATVSTSVPLIVGLAANSPSAVGGIGLAIGAVVAAVSRVLPKSEGAKVAPPPPPAPAPSFASYLNQIGLFTSDNAEAAPAAKKR